MAYNKYRKGSTFERELKKNLENKGFAVIRSAGSHGVDLVAGKSGKHFVFECKSTSKEKMYIPNEDVEKLVEFSEIFGGEPYLAVKIMNKCLFINPDDIASAGKNYALDYTKLCPLSRDIDELVGKDVQKRLI
ncbi:Holliday junction resolvase Hjc [Methanococcus voltae]|uniref:Crossover junction endodeoxyribonuclease Hjc n=2 Tax=Methanococcus voltae TaxID=2188 RepID=A0A8J7RGS1_METVO|nr:Holliday junction resolvase Hjc [Methanococcus voltae]MBP2172486.1 Holliday junction resolvase [Methanococcus voltae]MBP2201607.1 Holliday junction resolvase [Methanococcus voltae]MCS3922396.1 Holliday junction resolvase [Methanococcus voltae PS]